MTRGTVLIVGRKNRESELFAARLEREHFHVATATQEAKVWEMLKQHPVQAILFTPSCSKSTIERIERHVHRGVKTSRLPCILLAEADVTAEHAGVKGIGEAFRLHVISVAEAVRRLRLAIQLSQLVRR